MVLGLQFALGALYLLKTVPGNAPDEPAHFFNAESLASGRLPQVDLPAQRWSYEAFQPPLYYALAAPLLRLSPGAPHAWRVRLLRGQNLLFALLNVALVFLLARRLAGEEAGLCAAALAAFLPQYLFIGTSVSNDGLADLCASAVLLLAARGLARPASWAEGAWLGLAMGLALLTKATTASVIAAYALVCAVNHARRPQELLLRLVWPSALAAAAAVWPYLRNVKLYGDLSGRASMSYESAMHGSELGHWLKLVFESFWGLFGWMTSPLPAAAYLALAGLTLLGLAGFAFWARGRRLRQDPAWQLQLAAVAAAAGLTFCYGFLNTRQPQGRFLFPALGPIALILALGWRSFWEIIPERLRGRAGAGLCAAAAGLHWLCWRAL